MIRPQIKKSRPPSSNVTFLTISTSGVRYEKLSQLAVYIYIYIYFTTSVFNWVSVLTLYIYICVARAQIIHYFKKKMTFRSIILCPLQPLRIYIMYYVHTSHSSCIALLYSGYGICTYLVTYNIGQVCFITFVVHNIKISFSNDNNNRMFI